MTTRFLFRVSFKFLLFVTRWRFFCSVKKGLPRGPPRFGKRGGLAAIYPKMSLFHVAADPRLFIFHPTTTSTAPQRSFTNEWIRSAIPMERLLWRASRSGGFSPGVGLSRNYKLLFDDNNKRKWAGIFVVIVVVGGGSGRLANKIETLSILREYFCLFDSIKKGSKKRLRL